MTGVQTCALPISLDWVEAWYRLFDVLYQNGIRDALCAAYRPILTAVWDIWLHLTPEERKSPRMKLSLIHI